MSIPVYGYAGNDITASPWLYSQCQMPTLEEAVGNHKRLNAQGRTHCVEILHYRRGSRRIRNYLCIDLANIAHPLLARAFVVIITSSAIRAMLAQVIAQVFSIVVPSPYAPGSTDNVDIFLEHLEGGPSTQDLRTLSDLANYLEASDDETVIDEFKCHVDDKGTKFRLWLYAPDDPDVDMVIFEHI